MTTTAQATTKAISTLHLVTYAMGYADGLAALYPDKGFHVASVGSKYAKVAQTMGTQTMVHAFVDADGHVYKAAGWAAPAKGVRYDTVEAALAAAAESPAGWAGGYLYADYAKSA